MSNIREHAQGRWPEIISALVGERYADTRKHLPCPATGEGTDRFRFSDRNGTGNYFCACSNGEKDGIELIRCVYGCDYRRAIELVESVIGPSPKPGAEQRQEREQKRQQATFAQRLWQRAERSNRSRYLAGRGLEVAPGLRFVRRLDYRDEDGNVTGSYPAMIAPVVRDRELLTVHVTYLNGDRKAPVEQARKIMPASQPLQGAGVPLYRAGRTVGVAEGVETAVAATMLSGVPTHAALNTALMAQWQPPEGVEFVVIYADNDRNFAGHAAAYQLAHRLSCKGYTVDVHFPREPGDWNDVLLAEQKGVA